MQALDTPYPLKQKFYRIIIPILILITVGIGVIMGNGSSWLIQTIYLELSEKRASVIDRALSHDNGDMWQALQLSRDPKALFLTPKGGELFESLEKEVRELGLLHIKIYGEEGLILYSSEAEEIGRFDNSKGYQSALQGERMLVAKTLEDGTDLYELYIRVPNNSAQTVMELYEPVGYLNRLVMRVLILAILVPVVILLILGAIMSRLVVFAQKDINYRTKLIAEFRMRLESLVSDEAVSTIRSSSGQDKITSRRTQVTILFSDIRGFTDFCETQSPEDVVDFLNQSHSIVINTLGQYQGDVDKLIGDAVLAYFQGDDAQARALKAAQEIMEKMDSANLARGIGIGVYSGDVVLGTIGAASRMDFTLIGDSVNIASRLCSAASVGEIVIDEKSFVAAAGDQAHLKDSLKIRGRATCIDVCRIK